MNIPTAEEFSENYTWTCCPEKSQVLEAMIEFAKLHVEAALKEARRVVEESNGESILNSYPLTNIK
jgi:hypothetical protein